MNAKEIIEEYLRANGFNGLWNHECGCSDDFLMPCGGDFSQCKPGHTVRIEGGFDIIGERSEDVKK